MRRLGDERGVGDDIDDALTPLETVDFYNSLYSYCFDTTDAQTVRSYKGLHVPCVRYCFSLTLFNEVLTAGRLFAHLLPESDESHFVFAFVELNSRQSLSFEAQSSCS